MIKKTSYSILFKMILSYILILLIPLCSILIIYFTTKNSMLSFAKEQTQQSLSHLQESVDTRLSEIQAVATSIALRQDTAQLLRIKNISYTNSKIYDVYAYCQNMTNFTTTNTIVKDLTLILDQSRYGVAHNKAAPFTDPYFKTFIKDPGCSLTEFKQAISAKAGPGFLLIPQKGTNSYLISYVQPLPFHAYIPSGQVVITLEPSFFINSLQSLDQSGCASLIMDQDGKVISFFANEHSSIDLAAAQKLVQSKESQLPNDLILLSSFSTDSNWTYYHLIPKSILLQSNQSTRSLILFLGILSAFLGVFLAFFLTRDKAGAMQRLLNTLSPHTTDAHFFHTNEYQYLELSVKKLLHDNGNLIHSMDTQKRTLNDSALRRLLIGDFCEQAELEKLAHDTNLPSLGNDCIIILVSYHSYTLPENIQRQKIKETFQSQINQNLLFLDMENASLTILVFFDDKKGLANSSRTDGLCDAIHAILQQEYQIKTSMGLSSVCNSLLLLHQAYDEARIAEHYLLSIHNQYKLQTNDIPTSNQAYYYPIEIELKYLQRIKDGTPKELAAVIEQLYTENFVNRKLSYFMVLQLLYAIQSSLIRGLNGAIRTEDLCACHSLDEIFKLTTELNLSLCQHKQEVQHDQTQLLKEQLLTYLLSNYTNPDLNINTAATDLHQSVSTLYHFFKESMDESFSETLEKIRIDKACELLNSNLIPIKDVATLVGYNSDTSFRRVFKRVIGVTPGSYSNK